MWFLLTLVLLLVNTSEVLAQSTADFLQTSIQTGSEYRQSYSAFQLARNQHTQYNTAATRLAAIQKTNEVLSKRNNWQIGYLRFLRSSLADTTNIANYAQTIVYLDLENEIIALEGLSGSISSGTSFPEINTNSSNWEVRLEKTNSLTNASILQIASGRLEKLQIELEGLVNEYKTNHPEPTSNQQTTLNLIDQKILAAQAARTSVNNAITNYKNSFNSRNTQVEQLTKGKTLLIEATQLLIELPNQS